VQGGDIVPHAIRRVASTSIAASLPARRGMRRFSMETESVEGCSRRMANAILTTHGAHKGGIPSQVQSRARMSFITLLDAAIGFFDANYRIAISVTSGS